MSDVGRGTGDASSLEGALSVLRERWRIVAGAAVLVVAVVLALSLTATKQYEATATLLVQPSQATSLVNQSVNQNLDAARDQATALLLVTSGAVADRVKEQLNSPLSASELAGQVSAASEPDANLITVSATDPVAAQAARVANAFAQQFSTFRLARARAQLEASADDLRAQLSNTPTERQDERRAIGSTLQEVLKLRAVTTGGVEVVNRADVPTTASSPTPKRDVAFGLILGLLLGVGLAFVIDLLDRRVKTVEAFEELYGFGALASMPERSSTPATQRERQAAMEPFRIMRNGLALLGGARGVRVLMVTSAVPGEGKSTVAAGIARAIALSGERVTLVEADMRRPTFHHQFDLGEDPQGLTTAIVGGVPATTLTQTVMPGLDNLTVLPCGPVPPNAAELLGSARFAAVVEELLEAADFVVLDAPPLLPVADSQVLLDSSSIDAGVLVCRAFHTKREDAQRAAEIVRRHRLGSLGLVVNGLRNVGQSFDYYGSEV